MGQRQEDKITEYDKAIVNRLSKVIGHMKSIRTMVETDRDCSEVLIQLSAVKSAVNNAGKEILKTYITQSVKESLDKEDRESIHKLNKSIDSFMK
jgi:DNA-binding FrmR family transcriptional regulator